MNHKDVAECIGAIQTLLFHRIVPESEATELMSRVPSATAYVMIDTPGRSEFCADETKMVEAMRAAEKQIQFWLSHGIITDEEAQEKILQEKNAWRASVGLPPLDGVFSSRGTYHFQRPNLTPEELKELRERVRKIYGRSPLVDAIPIGLDVGFNVLPNNGEPTAEEWYKAQSEPCAGTPQPLGIITRVEPPREFNPELMTAADYEMLAQAGATIVPPNAKPGEYVDVFGQSMKPGDIMWNRKKVESTSPPQHPTDNRCMLDCPDCLVDNIPTGQYQGIGAIEKCKTCGGSKRVLK